MGRYFGVAQYLPRVQYLLGRARSATWRLLAYVEPIIGNSAKLHPPLGIPNKFRRLACWQVTQIVAYQSFVQTATPSLL